MSEPKTREEFGAVVAQELRNIADQLETGVARVYEMQASPIRKGFGGSSLIGGDWSITLITATPQVEEMARALLQARMAIRDLTPSDGTAKLAKRAFDEIERLLPE
jgi:hypothetical protein